MITADSTPPQKNLLARIVHRLKNDRGAVLVEAALAIPLLLLVILGATEAGLGWEAKSSTVSGVRTGVLRASASGDDFTTDLRVIQSIVGEVGGDNADRIEWIRIFDATGDPDAKFRACAADPGGFAGCVVYDQAFISSVVTAGNADAFLANFDGGTNFGGQDATGAAIYNCDPTAVDRFWCATQRTINGDTQLGVAISYKHEWFTGIFPGDSPRFVEYVTSSTFTDGGTNLGSAASPSLPFSASTPIPGLDFGSATDLSHFANATSTRVGGPETALGSGNLTTSPSGEEFLGPFSSGTVAFDIPGLQPGFEACVSFDLHQVGSWNGPGAGTRWGPDTVTATVTGTGAGPTRSSGAIGGDWNDFDDHLGYDLGNELQITICDFVPPNGTISVQLVGHFVENSQIETGTNRETYGIDNFQVTTAP